VIWKNGRNAQPVCWTLVIHLQSILPAVKLDKRLLIACLAALIAQSGITFYLPSLPSITHHFRAGDDFSALTLSLFLLGMGSSMLVWGKLAARWGSKRSLMSALVLFSCSALLLAVSTEATVFLAARVIQGIGAGGISVLARVLLREGFSGRQLAKALSYLSICFVMSLGLAQFAGALLSSHWGWQSTFIAGSVCSALLIAAVMRYMPVAAVDGHPDRTGWTAYRKLLTDARYMRPVLAGGLGYGVIIMFGTWAPAIFHSQFNWSVVEYGLAGWLISAAYLLGALSVSWWTSSRSQERSMLLGLRVVVTGGLLMAAGQLLFPPTVFGLLLGYCILLAGQGLVYPLCQSLASHYGAASEPQAVALTGFTHQAIAACCSYIGGILPAGHTGLFTTTCLILTLAALAIYSPVTGRLTKS
jgi:DHA1 family bicyclomycin/chloramphenicol resistance-like MFS transporter